MSFLLDPPILFGSGVLIGRYEDDETDTRRLSLAVLALFYLVSGLLYLDVLPWWSGDRWTRGSQFMLNSGLNTRLKRNAGVDVLAVLLFAAYPLWLWVGLVTGRKVSLPLPGGRARGDAEGQPDGRDAKDQAGDPA